MDQLLTLDTLRGEDSTGVFLTNNLGNVGLAKDVVTGGQFVQTDEYQVLRKRAFQDGAFFIGHNRKATRGSITDTNAHPFWVEDKLVLVHNGSYFGSHKELADTEVDSEAIAKHLAKADDLEKALQKVNAAYALIWYDVDAKELRIACNGQRPLHWTEDHGAYYISSESEILEFVLKRNKVNYNKIHAVPTDGVQVFKLLDSKRVEPAFREMDLKYKGYSFRQETYQPKNWGLVPRDDDSDWRNWHHGNVACGWESCDSDNTVGPVVSPTVKNLEDEIAKINAEIAVIDAQVASKVEDARDRRRAKGTGIVIDKLPIWPHYNKITFKKWSELKNAVYTTSKKVTVIVDDYVQDDDQAKEVIITGKTLDDHQVPTFFKITHDLLTQITESNIMDAVFEIEVDSCSWKRDPKDKEKNGTHVGNIDSFEGYMFVGGTNPKLRFGGDGVGHA
jgi:hypothetical protein